LIYHITTAEAAEAAQKSGEYAPEGFALEGFIHCSYAHQIQGVLQRRFQGRTNLVLLEIEPSRLPCPLVDENLEGGPGNRERITFLHAADLARLLLEYRLGTSARPA
jgi:uncharacterized protein (DUF952 family)